jgi:hypothetical protein
MKAGRKNPVLLSLAMGVCLLAAAGCGTVEKKIGIITRRVTDTRVETRKAPVPGWTVWVFVNGAQVGAYQTNAMGQLPINYQPYIADALQRGTGIDIEFRFRQPNGASDSKRLYIAPEQLRGHYR